MSLNNPKILNRHMVHRILEERLAAVALLGIHTSYACRAFVLYVIC